MGFDIERHADYAGELVIQDVLTLHGSQFRQAALIVASPPCQEYSYRAMPWKRAKAQMPEALPDWWEKPEPQMSAAELCEWKEWREAHPLAPPDNTLFDACFRIQREASAAAGHHIPLVVENVKGAQPWVGWARWHYGSFYLWGDVPALMPRAKASKIPGQNWSRFKETGEGSPHWRLQAQKGFGGSWFAQNHNTNSGSNGNPVDGTGVKCGGARGDDWFTHHNRPEFLERAGVKNARNWWSDGVGTLSATTSSHSAARKAASAQIAMIPYPLAHWIGRAFKPL